MSVVELAIAPVIYLSNKLFHSSGTSYNPIQSGRVKSVLWRPGRSSTKQALLVRLAAALQFTAIRYIGDSAILPKIFEIHDHGLQRPAVIRKLAVEKLVHGQFSDKAAKGKHLVLQIRIAGISVPDNSKLK